MDTEAEPILPATPGLLPPKELLVTSKAVDLIYEGVKYSLQCCQAGPRIFTVTTASSAAKGKGGGWDTGFGDDSALVEAQCRPLADGGYLLVVAGKSQVRNGKPRGRARGSGGPGGPGESKGPGGGKGGRRGTERAVERGELATYINLYSCLFPRDRREESGGDPRERGGGGGVEGAAGWGAHGAHAGPYAKVLIIIQFATLVGELRVRDAIHWLFPGDYSGCEQLVFRPVVLHAVGNPL